MKRINLAVLVSTLTIGGAEQLLLELLGNLDRKRFDMAFYFLHKVGLLGREELAMGYPAHVELLGQAPAPVALLRLARLFKAAGTDVLLLINHRNSLFYGVIAAKMAGVPVIVNWENETFKRYSLHSLTMIYRKVLHAWIDKVVAASEGHRDYIAREEGISRERVTTIYNGVDPARFKSSLSSREAKARLGVPPESPVVSMIAVLRPDKAHDVFLAAARRVAVVVPDAHFLIIGDGPRGESLMKMAGDMGLGEKVHFLGFRRDLGDILAGVDVNVLSSYPLQETLSVAVIEAMAASIPVVCTDVGFMREIVIPGKTGFLTEVGDSQGLASRIVELIRNEALRLEMGRQARALVQDKLSVQGMARGFERLFENELASKGRGALMPVAEI